MSKSQKLLTMKSKVKDIYENPIGHDIIDKVLLQLGKSEKIITNKLVSNQKLSTIAALTKKVLGEEFYVTLLSLLNSEKDVPFHSKKDITRKWWKEAVFYQIYPRSFYDTNQDGIGDINGIIEKLDYLKELGINAIWLSPIYDSPNDDNGYDIRDYRKILSEFGSMEDFDKLLERTHSLEMHLIMDLVVNHTSDEHEWFKEALKDEHSKYRDYYIFRKENGKKEAPNNWTSFFSGSAWNYYEKEKTWAMHLFSKKQMDLNWDNQNVRNDIIQMVNWWLDKGVDGFRMDVINYISKKEGLPDGDESIGKLMGFTGVENYFYGPHLHDYLREINEKAFNPHNAFSVGETPGLGMNMCQLITGEERKELDMVFSFDHLEMPGHVRYDDYKYDLNYYRDYMINWMLHYGNNCWMTLFYNNHDNPRMVSKINMKEEYHISIATLLAVMQFTLKGTPFIYQGDEMGLINYPFTSMDEIVDVEAKGYYKELKNKISEKDAFKIILAGTREHARVLLPWNKNVAMSQKIHFEMTEIYKTLIALREKDKTLVYGTFSVINRKKDRFVYERELNGVSYIVDCNLSTQMKIAHVMTNEYHMVFPQTISCDNLARLHPYEARIWMKK